MIEIAWQDYCFVCHCENERSERRGNPTVLLTWFFI